MTISGAYAQTAIIARLEFERFIAQLGISALWQVRQTGPPDSGGEISATTGHGDPVDDNWEQEPADTDVFSAGTTILVVKDIPQRTQDVGAHIQLLEGMSTAYCAVGNEVAAGDLLTIAGVEWRVESATLVTPPVYRQLTLQRRGG